MKDRGFLLFEAMISIAIIAVSFVFIAQSFAMSRKALKVSDEVTNASLMLWNKMQELETIPSMAGTQDKGVFEINSFKWGLRFKPASEPDVIHVIINVFPPGLSEDACYSVETYAFAK